MANRTLINLPPPPADPLTPSEMGPGTPNSTATSLSALSTVALKDGQSGYTHPHHHKHHAHLAGAAGRGPSHGYSGSAASATSSAGSTTTLDAERADRISRLAGLERLGTVRPSSSASNTAVAHAPQNAAAPPNTSSAAAAAPPAANAPQHPLHPQHHPQLRTGGGPPPPTTGYFDARGAPVLAKDRSTVGSASATGSAGGRTPTWTSGSDEARAPLSDDEDEDMLGDHLRAPGSEAGSHGGAPGRGGGGAADDDEALSDGASLVGFGEAASSTVSGPVSSLPSNTTRGVAGTPSGARGSPAAVPKAVGGGGGGGAPSPDRGAEGGGTPVPAPAPSLAAGAEDARMLDGVALDGATLDTTASRGPVVGGAGLSGAETAARIARERYGGLPVAGGVAPEEAGEAMEGVEGNGT